MREYEIQTSYGCDRREVVNVDCQLVQKHLNGRTPRLHFETASGCMLPVQRGGEAFIVDSMQGTCECSFNRSLWLPCIHILSVFWKHFHPYGLVPIHERWLAEYNLPIRRLVNPQLRPLAAANFSRQYKALHNVPEKPHDCSSRTAVECFDIIIAFASELVERARTGLTMDDSVTDSSASSVQPRWMKKPGTGLPCGCCFGPVQIDSYRCDADQLTFHSGCIEMADINECPLCDQQLRPQSPAINPTPPAIMKSKSRTQPTTDVDSDQPGDSVSLAHRQKKARVSITLSDYQPDIIENIRHNERFNDEGFI